MSDTEIGNVSIFITGATGFIGQALCVAMLQRGWKVKGVFRHGSGEAKLAAGAKGVGISSIEDCNFCARDFSGIDTIIHLAGLAHNKNSLPYGPANPFHIVNVLGTERLARAAASGGVQRFVFISSVKVNGEESRYPYNELDAPAPVDAYGLSKYEAESVLTRIAQETGMGMVILRLPLVYGPGVQANFRSLIKLSASRLPLPFKAIQNRRSLIYLGNLVDAIMTCVVHPLAADEIFMVSDGEDISTPELIRMIASGLHKKKMLFSLPIAVVRTFCGLIRRGAQAQRLTGSLVVDTSKIRNMLGWRPPFTMQEGISATLRSYSF